MVRAPRSSLGSRVRSGHDRPRERPSDAEGLIPRSLAVYGAPEDRRFAGTWFKNLANPANPASVTTSPVPWSWWFADRGTHQLIFDAEVGGAMRPAWISAAPDHWQLSVFRDDHVGEWWARHAITGADYQPNLTRAPLPGRCRSSFRQVVLGVPPNIRQSSPGPERPTPGSSLEPETYPPSLRPRGHRPAVHGSACGSCRRRNRSSREGIIGKPRLHLGRTGIPDHPTGQPFPDRKSGQDSDSRCDRSAGRLDGLPGTRPRFRAWGSPAHCYPIRRTILLLTPSLSSSSFTILAA